ncbi:MAG: hypothetical protein ACO1NX_02500 [Chitinophagaceae bacterium]
MKNAKEILQFTGYPLEPIVALEIKKTLEAQLAEKAHPLSPYVKLIGHSQATNQLHWDAAWFSNYE